MYETSGYLAVIVSNNRHPAAPTLSHLLFDLPNPRGKEPTRQPVDSLRIYSDAMFIYLLEVLQSEYPSQRTFLPAFRHACDHDKIPLTVQLFLQRVSTALRRSDFLSISSITSKHSKLLANALNAQYRPSNPSPLFTDALHILLNRIRSKAQDSAWRMLRSAYREADLDTSGKWLQRWLQLPVSESKSGTDDNQLELLRWFEERAGSGDAERLLRDGEPVKGRWSLRRPTVA